MARISVLNVGIEYELLGKPGNPAIALTPGGRFSKDTPGFPELAAALVAGGRRVLLWDRPNCGASDISFDANSESEMQGRALTALIRALGLGPTALVGGSAGARASLIAASRDPDAVSHLILAWISGGTIGLALLAHNYCCTSAIVANRDGMAAVANLPDWAEQMRRNPRNREIIMAQDPQTFVKTMERWAAVYLPTKESPVPGMSPADFQCLRMPTLVFRSGKSDLHHPRRTSEWVHELIPHSRLVEPPWGENEWNERQGFAAKTGSGHFAHWSQLAPAILDFTKN